MLYAWAFPKFCPQCGGALEDRRLTGDHRPRKVCARCAHVYYIGPKIAAGTVPVGDGKVWLVRRGVEPGLGLWSFPCGYVELDETLEDAARRETEEETGLQVRIAELLGIYTFPGPDGHIRVAVASYRSEVLGGSPTAADDVVEVQAFAPDAIPWAELAFHSSHAALRAWLTRAHPELPLPPHRFPADPPGAR